MSNGEFPDLNLRSSLINWYNKYIHISLSFWSFSVFSILYVLSLSWSPWSVLSNLPDSNIWSFLIISIHLMHSILSTPHLDHPDHINPLEQVGHLLVLSARSVLLVIMVLSILRSSDKKSQNEAFICSVHWTMCTIKYSSRDPLPHTAELLHFSPPCSQTPLPSPPAAQCHSPLPSSYRIPGYKYQHSG